MSYEEFQQLARLFVIGALDEDEAQQFLIGRKTFGRQAEAFIKECRKLNAIFALSLRPCDPDPKTKEKLFALIRKAPLLDPPRTDPSSSGCVQSRALVVALEGRFLGRN